MEISHRALVRPPGVRGAVTVEPLGNISVFENLFFSGFLHRIFPWISTLQHPSPGRSCTCRRAPGPPGRRPAPPRSAGCSPPGCGFPTIGFQTIGFQTIIGDWISHDWISEDWISQCGGDAGRVHLDVVVAVAPAVDELQGVQHLHRGGHQHHHHLHHLHHHLPK